MVPTRVNETWLSRKPQENSGLAALLVTLSVLLVSVLCWRDPQLYAMLASDSVGVFQNDRYWQLFTAVFVHADLRHFLSNAVLLFAFGYLLYGYFGFWVFPAGALLAGGLVNYLSLLTYLPREVRLVGASGVVYLMAAFWLTMFLLLERRHPWGKRLLRALGVGLVVLMPGAFDQSVSYRTHLIGAVAGLLGALTVFAVYRDHFRAAEASAPEESPANQEEPRLWLQGGPDEI